MKLKKIKVGEVADITRGASLSGEYYSNFGNLIRLTLGNFNYPNNGFKNNTSKDNLYFTGPIRDEFILKKGDIITPLTEQVRGLLGNTARIPEDDLYIQSGDIAKVIPKEDKLDDSFAYYWISSPIIKKQLDVGSQQTKIRHTSPDKLKDCVAFLPDLENQKKIGSLLSKLDLQINLNSQSINCLEKTAQILYNYWFLQFDFPDEHGKPYKASGGKMIWNETLKREIPEGWQVNSIKDLILDYKNGEWGKEKESKENILKVKCIRGADFPGLIGKGSLDIPTRFIPMKKKDRMLSDGDLIVEISGGSPVQSTGRIRYINQKMLDRFQEPLVTSNFCKSITLKDKKLQYWFYYLWETLYDNDVFFKYEGKTTGLKNLLFETFINSYKVAVPTDSVVEKFYEISSEIFYFIQELLIENQNLTELRDFLLPLLINGQVTISDEKNKDS